MSTSTSESLTASKPPPTSGAPPRLSTESYLSPAQRLPYDILVGIFSRLAELEEQQVGGEIFFWHGNELASIPAVVCRAWTAAAQSVLFKSVVLVDTSSAKAFLKTVVERPELARVVRYLVIGLSYEQTYPGPNAPVDQGQAEASGIVVTALDACPNLQHLQIRPLHSSCRRRLLPAVTSKALVSLICCPHLPRQVVSWTPLFYRQTDFDQVFPRTTRLRHLEVDAWVVDCEPIPAHNLSFPLRTLRLRVNICDAQLLKLLSTRGQALRSLDLYFERAIMLDDGLELAFRSCASTLRTVRYVFNPSVLEPLSPKGTVPLFDRLWPFLLHLEHLEITATEISSSLFDHVPPLLRTLVVQSYNDRESFAFDKKMIENLHNLDVSFGTLESFKVMDCRSSWPVESIKEMTRACAGRGIIFIFEADEDRLQG